MLISHIDMNKNSGYIIATKILCTKWIVRIINHKTNKKLNTNFMKNHHFFNLYINCTGLFLSFLLTLTTIFAFLIGYTCESKYKFYLKWRLFF